MGNRIRSIQSVIIRLCSPEEIRSLSSGEITKAETLNYRKMKPKEGGLFCESIFGPTKGWSCACGKLRMSERRSPTVCSVCGTEVVSSACREIRIGHIELNVPIAHPWFVSGHPSILGNLLGISSKSLARILHASCYLVNWVDEEACRREIDRLQAVTRDQERETGKKINAEILAILRERNQKIASLQAAKETLQNGLDSRFSQRAAKVTEEAGQIEELLRQVIQRSTSKKENSEAALAEYQEKRLEYQNAITAERLAADSEYRRKQAELREQGSSAQRERLNQLDRDEQKIKDEKAYEEAANNVQKVQLHNRFNFRMGAQLDDVMAEGCQMENFLKAHMGESFPQDIQFECIGKTIVPCRETISTLHLFSVMNLAEIAMMEAEKVSLLEFQGEIAQNRKNEDIILQKYQEQIRQTTLERKACLQKSGTETANNQLRTEYDARLRTITQNWAPKIEALDRELETYEQEQQRKAQPDAFSVERFHPKADGSGMEYARDLVFDCCGTVLAKAGETVSLDILPELNRMKSMALDEIQRDAETEIRRQQEALDAQIESIRQQAEGEIREIQEYFETQHFDVPVQDITTIECLDTLRPLSLLSNKAYRQIREYSPRIFHADTGAEVFADVLRRIDLESLRNELLTAIRSTEESQKKSRLIQRLNIVEAFLSSGVHPEWMILSVLPVLSPAFRPIFMAKNKRVVSSDLNDLYLLILRRNKQLRQLSESGAPEMMIRTGKRSLQDAVNCLFGCGSRKALKENYGTRRLFTLKDMITGERNPFYWSRRERAVDYAATCQAEWDEEIPLTAISLSYETAIKLYRSFLIEKIVSGEYTEDRVQAQKLIWPRNPVVEKLLCEILEDRPLLISHRGALQAEMSVLTPVLSSDHLTRLNPVIADLLGLTVDDSEIQIYLPLSETVCDELEQQGIYHHFLSDVISRSFPENGQGSVAMGITFLTTIQSLGGKVLPVFGSMDEAIRIFEMGGVGLRELISVRDVHFFHTSKKKEVPDKDSRMIQTTVGRILFNQCLPSEFEFINETMNGKKLNHLLQTMAWQIDDACVLSICEALLKLGNRHRSSCELNAAREPVSPFYTSREDFCNDYLLSAEACTIAQTWEAFLPKIVARLIHALSELTISSEDCGTTEGIWRIRGQRDSDEFFTSDICGRVSAIEMIDTAAGKILIQEGKMMDYSAAQKIAGSVVRSVYVRSPLRCGLEHGICAHCYGADLQRLKPSAEGLQVGMAAARQIVKGLESLVKEIREKPHLTGQLEKSLIRIIECLEAGSAVRHSALLAKIEGTVHLTKKNPITGALTLQIEQRNLRTERYQIPEDWQIKITDMQLVHEGDRIAEHQGETMNSGQTGGARINGRTISITSVDQQIETWTIPNPGELIVTERQHVSAGEALTTGEIDPRDILQLNGLTACQDFLLGELEKNLQFKVQSKYLEVLVRKMTEKVMVDDPGDSDFLPGTCVDRITLQKCNEKLLRTGERAAQSRDVLLGISEIAQHSASWMRRASLDTPIQSLLFAAINKESDPLSGIEERLITGRSFNGIFEEKEEI